MSIPRYTCMESAEMISPSDGFGKTDGKCCFSHSRGTGKYDQWFFSFSFLPSVSDDPFEFLFQLIFAHGNDGRAGHGGSYRDYPASDSSSIRCLRLFFRQPVVSFHRRLAGHGGDLLIDQILADAARILVEAVQHLQQKRPSLPGRKDCPERPGWKTHPPPKGSISKPMVSKFFIYLFKSSCSLDGETHDQRRLTGWAVYSLSFRLFIVRSKRTFS